MPADQWQAFYSFWLRSVVKCNICYNNVNPSVLVNHTKTVQDVRICFAPYYRTNISSFFRSNFAILNVGISALTEAPLVDSENWINTLHYLRNGKIGWKTLFTSRKLHTGFQMMATLNELE